MLEVVFSLRRQLNLIIVIIVRNHNNLFTVKKSVFSNGELHRCSTDAVLSPACCKLTYKNAFTYGLRVPIMPSCAVIRVQTVCGSYGTCSYRVS